MTPRRSLSLVAAAAVLTLGAGFGVDRSGATTPSTHRIAATAKAPSEALAVVAPNNEVWLARLSFNGRRITPKLIGPVTTPTTTHLIQVDSLVSSPDGKWLAWNETIVTKNTLHYIRNFVVLRNEVTGHSTSVPGHLQRPIGFAGDTLITSAAHAKRLVLRPSPHLVRVHDGGQIHAAYRHGVVDVKVPRAKRVIERLRLTSLSGRHIVLHSYPQTSSARSVATTGVSGDENWVAVERGDHTDFGGIGPSSIVDLFGLAGSHTRTKLGHFGTERAGWRVGTLTFSGTGDEVWADWYRARAHVRTRLTYYLNGKWRVVDSGVITVAGNTTTGDVVYQPGRFKAVPTDVQFVPVATTNAVILHHGVAQHLGLRGLEFAWAAR